MPTFHSAPGASTPSAPKSPTDFAKDLGLKLVGYSVYILFIFSCIIPIVPWGIGHYFCTPKQQDAEDQTQQTTVYVTNTGAKYHRAGCRYLSKSQIPISLTEARRRYSPCSVCGPPSTNSSPNTETTPAYEPTSPPSSETSAECGATTKNGGS